MFKSESNAFVALPCCSPWSHRVSRSTQARHKRLCLQAPQAFIQSERAMNLSPSLTPPLHYPYPALTSPLQGGSKSFGRCPSAALGLGWSTSAVRNCAGPLQLHWSTVGRTHVINPKHQAPTASPRKMCLFPLPPWRLLHGRNLLPKQARSQGGRVAVPSGAPSSI